jgi:YVTN family beta-propeller protein
MKKVLLSTCLFFYLACLPAQTKKIPDTVSDTTTLRNSGTTIEMPYNRLIQSAGTIITYGNPELENHTLDIIPLSDQKNLAVEDRYGIAVIDSRNNTIIDRWEFSKIDMYKDLMSTYSGITSFRFNNTDYILWSAAGKGKSFVMIAEWNGNSITNIKSIKLDAVAPAKFALPNQVAVQFDNNIPYLYIVLNGNNQLIKLRFTDQQVIWTTNTGVAPYGICLIQNKAYITNWAGPLVTDTTKENAGTPWGAAYTNPVTGAIASGTVSVIDLSDGKKLNEIVVGLHPNAIIHSKDNQYLYVANANSDNISVINVASEKMVEMINVGLFSKDNGWFGSSPNALLLNENNDGLYVANGMDNAIAVVQLGANSSSAGKEKSMVTGYIPTQAYPCGIALIDHTLYITNLEAKGASILSNANYGKNDIKLPDGSSMQAYSIHKQMASLSVIPVPGKKQLMAYTKQVTNLNLQYRVSLTNLPPRKDVLPKPLPERIGEPSVFKHVIYIIKENKTYDQVYGDIKQGRGDERLCIYGDSVTPNQHQLVKDFSLLDNYYASGKSSAEGHQWTDAAMASDYIEKNVRAWFRSYPHRQDDALVYNKNGFIWNNALDHGKKVRIFGEACTTHYDEKLKWVNFYNKMQNGEPIALRNTSTIGRIRPIISPDYPDCDNINFPDQLRADIFIKEWKAFEAMNGDNLPELIVLSLPDDHTAGTSPNFPTPRAMVADNDLAVGRIIETITHSRFWDSTVVFITEDDSQSGWDHISSYRTTGLVISPYSVLNKPVHTKYNQTSVVRSIEQILGIPPMNVIDATAMPLFDCFTNTKTNYRYTYINNKVPLNELNKSFASLKGQALYYAKLSANSAYKEIDGGEDDLMNRILWFDAKGTESYPAKK